MIVPTGSTEQHGPHGPLLTDVLIPQEVARRVAPAGRRRWSRRRSTTRCRTRTSGFTGVVHIRIPTFMALIEDLCASLAAVGLQADRLPERALRQHLRDRLRLRQRGRPAADGRPRLPDQLLGRHDGRRGGGVLRPDRTGCTPTGPRRRRCWRSTRRSWTWTTRTPSCRRSRRSPAPPPVHTAFFFSTPGSVHRATQSGTWGDARESTVEFGERYLEVVTAGDDPDARRHRADVRGDAAALSRIAPMASRASAGEPGAGAHHPEDPELVVELDEIGPLTHGDPATVRDAEQGERVAAGGGDRGGQRRRRTPRGSGPPCRGR